MNVRDASASDLAFIMAANTALAPETEGQALDPELLRGPESREVALPC
jgi:hypothetical protein